jgi:hypothetical protein
LLALILFPKTTSGAFLPKLKFFSSFSLWSGEEESPLEVNGELGDEKVYFDGKQLSFFFLLLLILKLHSL